MADLVLLAVVLVAIIAVFWGLAAVLQSEGSVEHCVHCGRRLVHGYPVCRGCGRAQQEVTS